MIAASVLVVLVAGGLGVVAVALNQVHARVGLVELTLNDGFPPGHAPTDAGQHAAPSIDPQAALQPGLHLFLSRSCHACQRLVDELTVSVAPTAAPSFHYIDRARPASRALATSWTAPLFERERELAAGLGADPLPFAIAVGPHGLVARSVTPTAATLLAVAQSAGLDVWPSGTRATA